MSEIKKNDALSHIINSGNNKMLFEEIKEKRKFDLGWIETLENLLPNVERAALKIRQAIKVEQEVVQIEKVKMVDASSIRHLAANSNNVQNIDKEGIVTPSKLLTSFKVEDYGVYENRFLKTLINRLYRYVNVRYNSIQKNYESYLRRELEVGSSFKHNDENITIKFSLEGRNNAEFDVWGGGIDQIMARLDRIKLIVNGLKYSPFMKLTSGEREVLPPIVRTNAIMKNVDFMAAYKLWTFIDRETSLKFDIDHSSTKLEINSDFQNDIIKILSDIYRKYRYYLHEKRVNRSAVAKLINKKPQIVPGYSGKFVISSEELKIENTQISEYYLQLVTSRLSDTYKDIVVAGRSRQEATKRVFRDLLMVADSIYDNIDFNQTPDSSDDCERLKYYNDKEKILAAYVDVKTVNLRKHQRELVVIQAQHKKLAARVEEKAKKEAIRQKQLKLREKKIIEQEKARFAKIISEQKAKKALEKQREIELAKALKEKIRLEKQKQKEKFLGELKAQKEKDKIQKEQQRIAKENHLKEERLKLAAKKESDRIQKELAKKAELEYQKELKAKEKVRLKQLKLQAIAEEKAKLTQAKAEEKAKKDREILETKELEKIRRQKEKMKQIRAKEDAAKQLRLDAKKAKLLEKRQLENLKRKELADKEKQEKHLQKALIAEEVRKEKIAVDIFLKEKAAAEKLAKIDIKKRKDEQDRITKENEAKEKRLRLTALKLAELEDKKLIALKEKEAAQEQKHSKEVVKKIDLTNEQSKLNIVANISNNTIKPSEVIGFTQKNQSKILRKRSPLKKKISKVE